jgi:HD superfamily phosphohydrolase
LSIPELAAVGAGQSVVRLPELDNVAITRRVARVIDHPHFQRLRRVRQLGPTSWVYPGATHTRFEHSLGVYGTATRYLNALLSHGHVRDGLVEEDLRTVLMAALLHDVGHYPFAHMLEAVHHVGFDTPKHEDLAAEIIRGQAAGLVATTETIAGLLEREMNVKPERVIRLITSKRADLERPVDRLLQSIISSAIDADKMDYLWRDSIHLGVPYGRGYDRNRLLNALTTNGAADALAVTSKGIISAEIFLLSRYAMFSEVYWHHAVRSVSCMMEVAWADLVTREAPSRDDLVSRLLSVGDDELLRTLYAEAPPSSVSGLLLKGIAGDRRGLYKRLVTWSRVYDDPIKRQSYDELYTMDRERLSTLLETLSARLVEGEPLPLGALLLDIPPRDKDSIPDVAVHYPRAGEGMNAYTTLASASRIVGGIAQDFIGVVKKIRLFIHPAYHDRVPASARELEAIVQDAISSGIEG